MNHYLVKNVSFLRSLPARGVWIEMKQERRCRTQTALLLVNPAELALLERMYEYESQIADELNVTTQVLEDYRSTLASA